MISMFRLHVSFASASVATSSVSSSHCLLLKVHSAARGTATGSRHAPVYITCHAMPCHAHLTFATPQAIAADPENAGVYSARAQTHIKLEDWLAAAEDAGKAVQLDPSSAKAHFRKG